MLRGIEVRRRKARTRGFVAPAFAGVPCRYVLQLVGPSLRAGTALVNNGTLRDLEAPTRSSSALFSPVKRYRIR